jgi:hypothetical protein
MKFILDLSHNIKKELHSILVIKNGKGYGKFEIILKGIKTTGA